MSDPLSVAGTAVGIVSLGIHVCKSLVSYLQSLEGRNQEIKAGLAEVEAVVSIFYSLNGILPKIDESSIDATTIRRCLRDSEVKLVDLQQFLIKLRGPQHAMPSTIAKIDEAGRSLIHPLRAGKLTSLRQSLQELLSNLNIAVNLVTLESASVIHDDVDKLQMSVSDLGAQICHHSDQLQSLKDTVNDSLKDFKQRASQIELRQMESNEIINAKLTLMGSAIGSIATSNQRLGEAFAELLEKGEFRSGSSISRTGTGALPIWDQASRHTAPRPPSVSASLSSHMTLPNCVCARQKHRSALSFTFGHAQLKFDQQVVDKHNRRCKYYGIDTRGNLAIKARIPLRLAWLSSRIILVCTEYTSGTGNPGIALRCRNIVPLSLSPVYRELKDMGTLVSSLNSSDEIATAIESCRRAIVSLYRDGKASPTDRDENGASHAALAYEILAADYERSDTSCVNISDSVLSKGLDFLQELVALVGVENEELLAYPLLHSSEYNGSIESLPYLVDTFTLDWQTILFHTFLNRSRCSLRFLTRHLARITEISPIVRAILRESTHELETCISINDQALTEKTFGFTNLHLCAPWPSGLRILLKTKARGELDYQHRAMSAISIAVKFDCIESVDLLLERECRIDFDRDTSVLFREASRSCLQAIASNLAERRLKLIALAHSLGLLQHSSQHHIVPDDETGHLLKLLDRSGNAVSPELRVPSSYSSIYHFEGTLIHHFPTFFENGFLCPQSRNCLGLLPVMLKSGCMPTGAYRSWDRRDFLESLAWLKMKGLMDQSPKDPLRLGMNLHATGWHYFGANSGYEFAHENKPCFSGAWDIMEYLSQVSARDNCVCWCSATSKGCSPLNSFLRSYAAVTIRSRPLWANKNYHQFFHCPVTDAEPNKSQPSNACVQFVRFLTFEALEMTHTCCYLKELGDEYIPRISPFSRAVGVILNCKSECSSDIRSDKREQDNARLLETLMRDFTQDIAKFGPSPKALEIFIRGIWRRRISEEFTVDFGHLSSLKQYTDNIKTHVLPETLRAFLGDDFELDTGQVQGSSETLDGEYTQEDNSQGERGNFGEDNCVYCEEDENEW